MKRSLSAILLLATLGACQTGTASGGTDTPTAADAKVTLTGVATYRQRIALPADATLSVQVSDVSRADAPAPVISETKVATEGRQVPLAFSLSYDPAKIDPRGRYSVSGRVTDGAGRLIWTTDTHVTLPPAGSTVELRLVQVTN